MVAVFLREEGAGGSLTDSTRAKVERALTSDLLSILASYHHCRLAIWALWGRKDEKFLMDTYSKRNGEERSAIAGALSMGRVFVSVGPTRNACPMRTHEP
eukprot:scaffold97022_cov26-Tisochrysis_lutea.AAC.1